MRYPPIGTFLICCFFAKSVSAQNATKDTAPKSVSNDEKKFTLGTLIVADYARSLTPNVDINGKHYTSGSEVVDGFFLRYVRVSGSYVLNKRISAGILVNLADFKSDPKTRVLENAYVRYKANNYAILTVGQFRPYFGLEDMYPFEFIKSYVWTNQYDLFGANGWQSFQLGASVNGSLSHLKVPLNYYFSVVNGNGKNQIGDNDKSKDVTARVEYCFSKIITLGANAGWSAYNGQKANAYGVDLQAELSLNKKWDFLMDAEYKNATNFKALIADTKTEKSLSDYRMGGYYFTPTVRYKLDYPNIKSIEVSLRHEYFESLIKSDNPRCTTTPMVAINLLEKYAARLSIGVYMDRYKKQQPGTASYNSNLFCTQLQFKF